MLIWELGKWNQFSEDCRTEGPKLKLHPSFGVIFGCQESILGWYSCWVGVVMGVELFHFGRI